MKRCVFTMVVAAAILTAGAGTAMCQTECVPTVWDLTAGQNMVVGTVTVSNDTTNLYVTYAIDTVTYPGLTLGNLHMWVGTDMANLPTNSQGTPVPGQFCQADGGRCFDASGLTSYTFTISFEDLAFIGDPVDCGDDVFIVTHAEISDGETAFGGDQDGWGNRWWFYGVYTICCDTPPSVDDCETAFAKGGWVWTTHRKSNPEDLPSLELTRNRWGWAINLEYPGVTIYDIWAGAGLNDTDRGTHVGVLYLAWNGTNATVTYDVLEPAFLAEVHLYAGDTPPETIAPGQYGYLDAPDSSTYTFNVPVADTDGDGVWLVAHAVVCTEY